jgi:hypothetical protein
MRVHNQPVAVECVPVRTTMSWRVMVTAVAVKMAWHPWAQSWAMESNELAARFGKTWAWRAERGRPGMRILPVCVLVMMVPSGRETWMMVLFVVAVALSRSLDTFKKWPEAPVSIMMGGEGTDSVELMCLLLRFKLLANSTLFACPLDQRP